MREKLRKIIESNFGKRVDKFCNSVWYIVAIGVVCVLCHSFDIPVVGAAFLTLLLVPALLFCKNSFVLAPFLMMCAFVLSDKTNPETGYYNTPLRITVLCLLLVIAIVVFVFNFIYYAKWKRVFKRAYLTISLAILSVALLMGGVGSETFSWAGMGLSVSVAITMFVSYSLMINCGEYQGRKTVEYFAWCVIIAALAICICFLKQYIIHDVGLFDEVFYKEYLKLGFVGPNTGAAIITLAIPMTFYLVYVYKHGYAFLALVAVELLFVLMSHSRASLVIAVPGTAIVSIWLCFKKKNGRFGYWIAFGIAVAVVLIIVMLYRHLICNQITALIGDDTTGRGRTLLWSAGLEAWKSSPIFGICLNYLSQIGLWYYSFHCTPLTYLFCTGVVGLAAYVYHRYRTVRLTFSAKLTAERVFVATTVLAMLCNALLDIAMTSATHLLYYGIMLALIECDVRKVKAKQTDCIESASDEDNKTEPAVQNDGDTVGEISLQNTNNEEGKI